MFKKGEIMLNFIWQLASFLFGLITVGLLLVTIGAFFGALFETIAKYIKKS